jgi:hypothetical protein
MREEIANMKKLEGIKITRILVNALIVASVIVALTSGWKFV